MSIRKSGAAGRKRRRLRGARPLVRKRRTRAGKVRKPGRAKAVAAVRIGAWLHRAFQEGRAAANRLPAETPKSELNAAYVRWSGPLLRMPEARAHWGEFSRKFVQGWASGLGIEPPDWVLVPSGKSISVVMTAMNEEEHIGSVLHQVQRMPVHEAIVVVNGSTDGTLDIAKASPIATVLEYEQPLGHDVGRAVGAERASGDLVLFLDGDLPIPAEQLIPFVAAIEQGADLALNDLEPFIQAFSNWDGVTVAKAYLNSVLGRPDLQANSITAIPHALSRRALDLIGTEQLIVPPKAQAMIIMHGLRAVKAASIDVITKNRVRKINTGAGNPVSGMILGDHLEALQYVLNETGPRFMYHDSLRKRWMAALRKDGSA